MREPKPRPTTRAERRAICEAHAQARRQPMRKLPFSRERCAHPGCHNPGWYVPSNERHVSDATALAIHRRALAGEDRDALAEEFGISVHTVRGYMGGHGHHGARIERALARERSAAYAAPASQRAFAGAKRPPPKLAAPADPGVNDGRLRRTGNRELAAITPWSDLYIPAAYGWRPGCKVPPAEPEAVRSPSKPLWPGRGYRNREPATVRA